MRPTDEEEIINIIKKLRNKKSPGHDSIKSDLVKQVANQISYPLKKLFNLSLSTGKVPDDMKIAKVAPIYKKDSPEQFGIITASYLRFQPFQNCWNALYITDVMIL